MKALVLKPELVLPWDGGVRHNQFHARAKEEKANPRPLEIMLKDAEDAMRVIRRIEPGSDKGEGWFYVPLVPVLEAPGDLRHLGEYVVYNGNHRWRAAKEAGIYLPCMLLENDDDMRRIEKRDERLSTRVPYAYLEQKEEVWRIARDYHLHPARERKQMPHWRF
ncbi:MAG: ParB N-terminal domain-containing protein [Nanoarchaeota archaeon]|nr:ParB N-terminal domain-containing protein [Nanoarchaeota archaeon]